MESVGYVCRLHGIACHNEWFDKRCSCLSGALAVSTSVASRAVAEYSVFYSGIPRRQRRQGWCESAETSAAFVAWSARENALYFLRAHPRDRIAWKTLRTACANLQQVVAAGIHAYFEEYLAETGRLLANNDQRGFYRYMKSTVGLEGKKARSEQFIREEDGTLLRDRERIRE